MSVYVLYDGPYMAVKCMHDGMYVLYVLCLCVENSLQCSLTHHSLLLLLVLLLLQQSCLIFTYTWISILVYEHYSIAYKIAVKIILFR